MIIIKKKNSDFIISRNTCKKLAEHWLRTSGLHSHSQAASSLIRFMFSVWIYARYLQNSPVYSFYNMSFFCWN